MGTVIDRYLRVIDELVRLERANVIGVLEGDARARWLELTRDLFGAPPVERRRHFRLQAHHVARILDLGEGQIAHVTSLSMGGLFLQLDLPAEPLLQRTLNLELYLPLEETSPVRCRVRVCRLRPAPSSGAPGQRASCGAGVRFVDPSREVESLLLRYIKQRLLNVGRVATSAAQGDASPVVVRPPRIGLLDR